MVKKFFTEVSKTLRDVNLKADLVVYEVETSATGLEFQINSIKLPVVTLPINDNIKFLENAKQGFERTISLKFFG